MLGCLTFLLGLPLARALDVQRIAEGYAFLKAYYVDQNLEESKQWCYGEALAEIEKELELLKTSSKPATSVPRVEWQLVNQQQVEEDWLYEFLLRYRPKNGPLKKRSRLYLRPFGVGWRVIKFETETVAD